MISTSLSAEQTALPSSMLTLEFGRDSAATEEVLVDLDLGFDNGLHLRGLLGQTWLQSENSTQENQTRLIGISNNYSAPLVGGFDMEYWGDAGALETRTKRFKLGANTDDWYLQLTYEDRVTRFYTEGVLKLPNGKEVSLPDYVEVDSTGTGLSVTNYHFYPWVLSISYIKYTYGSFANGRKVNELTNNGNVTRIFSLPTLGMATGLESWRRSGDLSYNFDWGVLGVSGLQSESEVDGSLASDGAIYVSWNVNAYWSCTLTAGRYGTDVSPETYNYGRLAVSHSW